MNFSEKNYRSRYFIYFLNMLEMDATSVIENIDYNFTDNMVTISNVKTFSLIYKHLYNSSSIVR